MLIKSRTQGASSGTDQGLTFNNRSNAVVLVLP